MSYPHYNEIFFHNFGFITYLCTAHKEILKPNNLQYPNHSIFTCLESPSDIPPIISTLLDLSVKCSYFVLMWNAVANHIPYSNIQKAHIDFLKSVIDQADECGYLPPTQEIEKALRFLENDASKLEGFRIFRAAMRVGDASMMQKGLKQILRNLGREDYL